MIPKTQRIMKSIYSFVHHLLDTHRPTLPATTKAVLLPQIAGERSVRRAHKPATMRESPRTTTVRRQD